MNAEQFADTVRAPMHPFSDEEVEQLAVFASIDPAKVRGIAWLTVLKLRHRYGCLDRSRARISTAWRAGENES